VILEGSDSAFGGVDSVFFRWDPLEAYLVAEEGVFEVLGALVVKDVEFGSVTPVDEHLVGGFPSVADGGGFAVGNGDGVDRVCILVVQHENVIVATAGGNRKAAGLIGEGFQDRLVVEEHGAELVGAVIRGRLEVGVGVRWCRVNGWGRSDAGGPDVSRFLVLVPEGGSQRFWEMLCDEIGGESWEGVEVALSYGADECGGRWAAERCMVVGGELLLGLVQAEDAVGLVSRSGGYLGCEDGNGPQTAWHAFAGDDDLVPL